MSELKVHLFGPLRIESGDGIIEVSLNKARALFAYLILTGKAHSRDTLAALFWPESDQRSARGNLRRTLYRLNQEVGDGLLLATTDVIERDPAADIWVDVEAFAEYAAVGLGEETAGLPSAERLAALEQAAALFHEEFLAGFTLPDCPEFDEWQFFQRDSLRRTLASVLIALATTYQEQEEWEQAITISRRWLALDSLHEPAHRHLMQLYARANRQAAALRQYEECVRLLDEELDVEPQPETTQLYEAIRTRRLDALEASKLPAAGPRLPQSRRPAVTTRYVRSGDIHIAYQVIGQGPPDLLFVGGMVSHLDMIWEDPALVAFWERLAAGCRLILFDKRGMGLSDRIGYPPTLEHTMDDILAVMEAAGCRRPVLMGVSEGGPNSALFAATYPQRLSGLILYGTVARFTRNEAYPWALRPEQWDRWVERLVNNWGEPTSIEYFAPSRAHEPAFREWWAQMLRLASSPGGVRAVLDVAREIDVRHVLPAIQVPTLVVHRSGDRMMRAGGARYIAQQIPGARYAELPGDDHWWWVGDANAVLAEIESFLQSLEEPRVSSRQLATILFGADPSGSTLTPAGQALLREAAIGLGGREVIDDQGRFALIFDGPSRALACARAVREAAGAEAVPLRLGLHTGECDVSSSRVTGLNVEVARVVLQQAGVEEILVSRTVKDLVAGSGFTFVDRGPHRFEALGQEWPLFALE